MAYELYFRLYDRDGVLKRGYVSPLWARINDSINSDDPLVFGMNVDSEGALDFAEFDLVEVMLRNKELLIMDTDGDFVTAFVGIVRDWEPSTDEDGQTFIQYTAPGINHLLSFRSILWYAGVADRSSFDSVAAETVMKTLVTYNCTSSASVANGRQRNGDLLPGMGYDISVAADFGLGSVISATFKGGNLLSSLQKLADQAGGDFGLSWLGSNDYEFEFYPGQLGSDKSSGSNRVLFSIAANTMRNPRLIRTGAKSTVAVAAGQGQEEQREISVVFGSDYSVDYDLETFVDARQEKTADGRSYRGALKLDETRIRERLSFSVMQTTNQFYSPIDITGRKTYKTGDLVLAVYMGVEQIRKIESVQIYWSDPQSGDAFNVDIVTREVVFGGS